MLFDTRVDAGEPNPSLERIPTGEALSSNVERGFDCLAPVDSTGGCNKLVKSLGRCFIV